MVVRQRKQVESHRFQALQDLGRAVNRRRGTRLAREAHRRDRRLQVGEHDIRATEIVTGLRNRCWHDRPQIFLHQCLADQHHAEIATPRAADRDGLSCECNRRGPDQRQRGDDA